METNNNCCPECKSEEVKNHHLCCKAKYSCGRIDWSDGTDWPTDLCRERAAHNRTREALGNLMREYRDAIDAGYERIKSLGGCCDLPDVLIAKSKEYQAARKALEGVK